MEEFKAEPKRRQVFINRILKFWCEEGNGSLNQATAMRKLIYPSLGICKKTLWNCLHIPEKDVKDYPLPIYLEYMLRICILPLRKLSANDVSALLKWIYTMLCTAIDRAGNEPKKLNVKKVIRHFIEVVAEQRDLI